MNYKPLSSEHYKSIEDYLKKHDIKLFVADFNGVLDNYYETKYSFLLDVLGKENEHHFAELVIFTDTEYINNRNATLDRSVRRFFDGHGIPFDERVKKELKKGEQRSHITPQAREFLLNLGIPYVIYTSQHSDVMRESMDGHEAALYSRDRTGNEKPSVANLQKILNEFELEPGQVCVLGDGLIDDLLPAKLLGMHTILVSPFADVSIG
jgi:FMN phosphatase YigB (HAD superfamily)